MLINNLKMISKGNDWVMVDFQLPQDASMVELLQSEDGGETWSECRTEDNLSTGKVKINKLAKGKNYLFKLSLNSGDQIVVSNTISVRTNYSLLGILLIAGLLLVILVLVKTLYKKLKKKKVTL